MRGSLLTSDLLHLAGALPPTNEPLRVAVRRLRWFRSAFRLFVAKVSEELGCSFEIDDTKLAGVFVRWLNDVEYQRPHDRDERRAFFEFVSGLMLRELVDNMPIRATSAASLVPADSPAAFWPEGYACTAFCLAVHAAAINQEYGTSTSVIAQVDRLHFWWSLRENVQDDPRLAAGFLQLALGLHPNWTMPDRFSARTMQ